MSAHGIGQDVKASDPMSVFREAFKTGRAARMLLRWAASYTPGVRPKVRSLMVIYGRCWLMGRNTQAITLLTIRQSYSCAVVASVLVRYVEAVIERLQIFARYALQVSYRWVWFTSQRCRYKP